MPTEPRLDIFVCYSHADAAWLKRVQVHLRPLVRDERIKLWDDTRLTPGDRWRDDIQSALAHAKVAVLLISADFYASDFIAKNELPPLLDAQRQHGLVILGVHISRSRFDRDHILSEYQSVNPPDRPVKGLLEHEQDEVFDNLVRRIEILLETEPIPQEHHIPKYNDTRSQHPFFVPHPRPHLIGRNALLQVLHSTLMNTERAAIIPSLSGQGGIGKTQLAALYAHTYRSIYSDGIFWLNMSHSTRQHQTTFVKRPGSHINRSFWGIWSPFIEIAFAAATQFARVSDQLVTSGGDSGSGLLRVPDEHRFMIESLRGQMASFARKLGLTPAELTTPGGRFDHALAECWLGWIAQRQKVLVVLDNLEDPKLLYADIPGFPNTHFAAFDCKLIITSRQPELPFCTSVLVEHLPDEESLQLLIQEAGRTPLGEDEIAAAHGLLRTLGGLPLALKIAGGLLQQNATLTFAGLSRALQRRGALYILDEHGKMPFDYKDKMARTLTALLAETWYELPADRPYLHELVMAIASMAESKFLPTSIVGMLVDFPQPNVLEYDPLEEALAILAKRQILERRSRELDRRVYDAVRLHPLIREFAFVNSSIDFRRDIFRRLVRKLRESILNSDFLERVELSPIVEMTVDLEYLGGALKIEQQELSEVRYLRGILSSYWNIAEIL